MKKTLGIILALVVLSFSGNVYARVTGQEGMMTQGKIRTCLSPKLEGKAPPAWFKRAQVAVRLTGACEAETCTIIRCNSNNKEIEENENFEKKCKAGKIGNPNCADKLDENQKKIEKSVEKKPGCQTIGFTSNTLTSTFFGISNVLGETTAQVVPNGTVNVLTNENDYTAHVDYTYYAVGDVPPQVVEAESPTIVPGSTNSQQLAQIGFNTVNSQVSSKSTSCTKISWDPYGRVFDAVSLEPMSDIEVMLIDEATKKPVVQEFEDNFDFTDMDGLFNILVENSGMYMMTVNGPQTHSFISNPSLHANYSRIYSDIYSPGKAFEEIKGVATHHDIALQPKGEPYTDAVAEVMTADEAVDMGEFMIYTGKTSFPFSQVCMVTEDDRKNIGECVFADKFGEYSITVEKSEIPARAIVPQAAKVDLRAPLGAEKVYEPTIGFDVRKYEPILSHIDGFAYDDTGMIVPFASIQIKQKMDDAVIYETVANEVGYFTVYSKDLPIFEYYITITSPNNKKQYVKSTSQFLAENADYIADNKLDLILAKKDGVVISEPTTEEVEEIASTNKKNQQSYVEETIENENRGPQTIAQVAQKNILLIGAIVILLFLGVGMAIYFLRSQKKQIPPFPQA